MSTVIESIMKIESETSKARQLREEDLEIGYAGSQEFQFSEMAGMRGAK